MVSATTLIPEMINVKGIVVDGTEINFQNNYCHIAQVSELGRHT